MNLRRAAVVLVIAAAAIGCGRRPDHQKLLTAALHRWEERVRPKSASPEQYPTLTEAAQLGDAKAVTSILERRTNERFVNEGLLTAARSEPLVLDDADGQREIDLRYALTAQLLLAKGANVQSRDEVGNTPLIAAARNGETAVVELLLEKGAKIEATNSAGETALIAAACMCPSVDMPDTDDAVRLLLDHGANIEAQDKSGMTPLIAAAAWGRASIIRILLDRGAKIEAKDHPGNTALLVAASGSGYPTANAVETLLTRGADIEAKNNYGQTALMLAAAGAGFEDVRIVKLLLRRGADVHAEDSRGRTALAVVGGEHRQAKAALLRARMAK